MATISEELIEGLLNEEEGTALDFKASQYRFSGATAEDKSELLKDILAMANSWRRSDAFILIGVQDVQGGRGRAVGVAHHLDDAQLQQFVNSKTQRPAIFSYHAYPFEGIQLGVIHIPRQERPLYLTKDFGRLEANVVYLRRGSSTDTAKPDEIARMGATPILQETPPPELAVSLADLEARRALGPATQLASVALAPLDVPDYVPDGSGPSAMPTLVSNPDYLRELAEFVRMHEIARPIGFVVENGSGQVALGTELHLIVPREDGLVVLDHRQMPERPSPDVLAGASFVDKLDGLRQKRRSCVCELSDRWEVSVDIGKVLPHAHAWAPEPIFLGSRTTGDLVLAGRLLAENLPQPIPVELTVHVAAAARDMELDDLLPLIEEGLM